MSINIITGINSSSRETLDKRSGPYDSLALAKSSLNTNSRYVGLKVLVVTSPVKDGAGNYIGGTLLKYEFVGGIADINLVPVAVGNTTIVEDLLTSTSTVNALSANQGKVLKGLVDTNTAKNSYPSADATKLAGIDTGATIDQTGAQIKTAYELEANTNAFTDAEKAKVLNVPTDTNASLLLKVDKVTGKGLSANDYTTSEKNKLAGLEASHFKGSFISLSALNTAFPSGVVGDYADVDTGVGVDVKRYIWDNTDSIWAVQAGTSTALTNAQIKAQYEANADTYAFTNADKTTISSNTTKADANAIDIADNTTLMGNNALAIGNKVDKISGKGLSTLDYTASEAAKSGETMVDWTAKTYINPAVSVKQNRKIYQLNPTITANMPTTPYVSTNFANEFAAGDWQEISSAFPKPDIYLISPISMAPGTTRDIQINGSFFKPESEGMIVSIAGGNVVNFITFINSQLITINITSTVTIGTYNITLDNGLSTIHSIPLSITPGTYQIPGTVGTPWIGSIGNILSINRIERLSSTFTDVVSFGIIPANTDFKLNFRIKGNTPYTASNQAIIGISRTRVDANNATTYTASRNYANITLSNNNFRTSYGTYNGIAALDYPDTALYTIERVGTDLRWYVDGVQKSLDAGVTTSDILYPVILLYSNLIIKDIELITF